MSNTTIDNTDDTIDSRDVITRIEELESDYQDLEDQRDETEGDDARMTERNELDEKIKEWKIGSDGLELEALKDLASQGENSADDWGHGVQLIRDSYFEQAMDEMVSECYEPPKDWPFWMTITYDYDALKQDYTSVDFDGETYWVR